MAQLACTRKRTAISSFFIIFSSRDARRILSYLGRFCGTSKNCCTGCIHGTLRQRGEMRWCGPRGEARVVQQERELARWRFVVKHARHVVAKGIAKRAQPRCWQLCQHGPCSTAVAAAAAASNAADLACANAAVPVDELSKDSTLRGSGQVLEVGQEWVAAARCGGRRGGL